MSFRAMARQLMAAMHPPTYVHTLNVAAISRFLAGKLIERNPDLFWPRFDHYVQLNGEDKMPPRIFQEAAWLFANMQGQEGLDEWSLEPGVQENFAVFMRQLQQFSKTHDPSIRQFLYQNLGHTYYFEYFFLRDITYY